MGKSTGSSETTVQIPEELKPIYSALGAGWSQAMQQHPMTGPESWYGAGQQQWGYGPFGSQSFWQAPLSEQRQNPVDVWSLMGDRFARGIPNAPQSAFAGPRKNPTVSAGVSGPRRTPRPKGA